MKNRIKRLFNKKTDWTLIEKDGNKTLVSPDVMDFFNSKLPNPQPFDLSNLIDQTEKITISERKIEIGKIDFNVVAVLDKEDQIKTAGEKLDITTEPLGHVLDSGSYIFDFTTKSGENHFIEYMGSIQIRWKEKWKEDAQLKNHIGLLEWLNDLGIDKPLTEYNNALIEEEKYRVQYENWINKLPKSIIKAIENNYEFEYDKIYSELIIEIEDEKNLILKLYKLFGCGFGVWNGFPTYEMIPEQMLLRLSVEKLTAIDNTSNLTDEHKHGMARLFSGHDFYKKRKDDIAKLPSELKQNILEHLIELGDQNKITLFKNRVSK